MSRWVIIATLPVMAALSGGCRNACQNVCLEMAQAAEECGIIVTSSELDACIASQKKPEPEARQACATYGDAETISAEWDCAEIGAYFSQTVDDTDG